MSVAAALSDTRLTATFIVTTPAAVSAAVAFFVTTLWLVKAWLDTGADSKAPAISRAAESPIDFWVVCMVNFLLVIYDDIGSSAALEIECERQPVAPTAFLHIKGNRKRIIEA